MHVVCVTERLLLRQFTVLDAAHLFELDDDPEVIRFLTKGKPTPLEATEHEVLPQLLREYELRRGRGCGPGTRLPASADL